MHSGTTVVFLRSIKTALIDRFLRRLAHSRKVILSLRDRVRHSNDTHTLFFLPVLLHLHNNAGESVRFCVSNSN
jgi:hypothetical protein